MLILFGVLLVLFSTLSGLLGIRLLQKSTKNKQTALGAFTDRRNGISCILLSFLFLLIDICINL